MRFKVKEARVVEETNRSTGEIYRQQWVFYEVDGIDKPFKIGLGKREPFPAGEYVLGADSFQVNKYDKLELRFPNLVPVASAAASVRKAS